MTTTETPTAPVVTEGDSGTEAELRAPAGSAPARVDPPGASVKGSVPLSVLARLPRLPVTRGDWWMEQGKALREVDLVRHPPASLAAIWDHARRGDFAPGEQHRVIEALGRIYGIGVALPVSVLLYATAWVLQRPSRFLVSAALLTIVWMTW